MADIVSGKQTLVAGTIYTAVTGTDIRLSNHPRTINWRVKGDGTTIPTQWNKYKSNRVDSLVCNTDVFVMVPIDTEIEAITGVV